MNTEINELKGYLDHVKMLKHNHAPSAFVVANNAKKSTMCIERIKKTLSSPEDKKMCTNTIEELKKTKSFLDRYSKTMNTLETPDNMSEFIQLVNHVYNQLESFLKVRTKSNYKPQ